MEKRTLLAVVLSIITISGFYLIQYTFFPPKTITEPQSQTVVEQTPESIPADAVRPVQDGGPAGSPLPVYAMPEFTLDSTPASGAESFPQTEQFTVIETPLIIARLTNAGGDITGFKLKEHSDGADYVDMILDGTSEAHAFTIAFGGRDSVPVNSFFNSRRISDMAIEYYRDFSVNGGVFRLTKRYTFDPDEYMFQLEVSIDGGYSVPSLNFASAGEAPAAYTLAFGPQIGPSFNKLDGNYDYRRYMTFINGKLKEEKANANQAIVVSSRVSWAAIAGKYFAFIAVPDATAYEFAFSSRPAEPGIETASRLFITRPPLSASRGTDTFRFYLGPKTQKALAIYDNGANDFGYTDLRLEQAANAGGFWGILNPLETLLKWLLNLFYHLIPNYGVAIILVTMLVRMVMFPLTKKGSEATLRMQTMSPKIKEIQAKYKDNPQKMNVELAGLYKKEGYSPLSGCLPMLIQLPIFLAMYNLFNNHFELRGAMFIPGWIPDLSVPETVWNFAPFKIPILGWSDLRLLPFIYVGSQLLYGKVTQTPDQANNSQMKMMLYAMPLIFFFILYNVPSGLLVYWIMSNVLTMLQQLVINKIMAGKKAALAAAQPEKKVIVPPKKKKKR
ncbi:MAG: membrane protein insertase YidC [Spirochaetaceae bacterium]|jgi:YidC/Oxa1 family membrane protein insertase|nr:membrane protein insertase YidC [Spirochaetaceae bacterium]